MAESNVSVIGPMPASQRQRLNVADRLRHRAQEMPTEIAVACPHRWSPAYPDRQFESGTRYATTTFADLDSDATRLARGLIAWGVPPGTRLALLVRPGIEFVTIVFALLRAGMVVVLVDPGLGKRNLVRCLSEAKPEGFIAVGAAQALRTVLQHRFPHARWNVTVGRRWFWGGLNIGQLRALGDRVTLRSKPSSLSAPSSVLPATQADDPAAIIFTSGSTGTPKGVLYTHRMFDTQVTEIQSTYGIEPGGIDLACFPLFALFNSAMGVTTVLPEMNFSRPASANPALLLTAANDWRVTQAFASPAVWRIVGNYSSKSGARINSLRQVFSCGAPVPADVLRSTLACVSEDAKMHTPYGATECLPVATIEADEVLNETAAKTAAGAGVCVGRKFDSIDWRIIRISDEPIASIGDAEELPPGQIGELIVRGPQASPRYVTQPDANVESKIADGDQFWHRMGDVGYFDADRRFWYCGRKSHRVETANRTLFSECVEAIANTHPSVRRSALVGVGPTRQKTPLLICEMTNAATSNGDTNDDLMHWFEEHDYDSIDHFVCVNWSLPVDVRHNAKINRETLAVWASRRRLPHLTNTRVEHRG